MILFIFRRAVVRLTRSRIGSFLFSALVIRNPSPFSPPSTVLVPLQLIFFLVLYYLRRVLFSGFLQFKCNFVLGKITQNTLTKQVYWRRSGRPHGWKSIQLTRHAVLQQNPGESQPTPLSNPVDDGGGMCIHVRPTERT